MQIDPTDPKSAWKLRTNGEAGGAANPAPGPTYSFRSEDVGEWHHADVADLFGIDPGFEFTPGCYQIVSVTTPDPR